MNVDRFGQDLNIFRDKILGFRILEGDEPSRNMKYKNK